MKNDNPKIVYSEPLDYFPKEIRQKYKLGEYAESPLLTQNKSGMLVSKTCHLEGDE